MKTKIVCTIGPSTESEEMIEKLASAGMNIARINCSHNSPAKTRDAILRLKKVREAKGLDFEIMLDTKGPDVRIGTFENGKVELKAGGSFILTTDECIGNESKVFVNCPLLPQKVSPGQVILLNDGLIKVVVTAIKGNSIVTQVEQGGVLSSKKTMFAPGCNLGLPFISVADELDLLAGLDAGIDSVAASFVGSRKDLLDLKAFMRANGGEVPIISKIESSGGIENLAEILDECAGVMVARGDLGVEYPIEQIPVLQKKVINAANKAGKFVIVATEMMESMITKPRPTRAETTDVANAVWDGANAVMLSAESATGAFPVETVTYMKKIAQIAEDNKNVRFGE